MTPESAAIPELAVRAKAAGLEDSADDGRRADDDRLDPRRKPGFGARDETGRRAVEERNLRCLEHKATRPFLPNVRQPVSEEELTRDVEFTAEHDLDLVRGHGYREAWQLRRLPIHAASPRRSSAARGPGMLPGPVLYRHRRRPHQ